MSDSYKDDTNGKETEAKGETGALGGDPLTSITPGGVYNNGDAQDPLFDEDEYDVHDYDPGAKVAALKKIKEANKTPEEKKDEKDEEESKDAEKRVDSAKERGSAKASAEYAEKKRKCAFKKNQIAAEKQKGRGTIKSKKNLEKWQKEFKGLACGKYFDDHKDKHEEAHKTLAGDSAGALADHKNRVHKAISGIGNITSGGILKILSETIGKRSNVAMKKVLLKSDELIDVVVAALEQKMKTSGLPAIMGIEIVTGIISFIIDIIPIPGIGILSTAVETAGDVVINVISAVGPDSLIKIVEDKFLPIIEKIAVIFQGLAGSFSCCDKDKRVDKINISSATKKELIDAFKTLKTSIGAVNGNKKGNATTAIKKIDEALKFLGDSEGKEDDGNFSSGVTLAHAEPVTLSGGARRRTRRRRHHKTKRKRFRRRKTRVKKKHRKKRTQKH
jgi:hypothetical protein